MGHPSDLPIFGLDGRFLTVPDWLVGPRDGRTRSILEAKAYSGPGCIRGHTRDPGLPGILCQGRSSDLSIFGLGSPFLVVSDEDESSSSIDFTDDYLMDHATVKINPTASCSVQSSATSCTRTTTRP